MKCPNCGRENSDGANFCGGCGSKLPHRKNGRWKWLAGAAVLVCLAVAVGCVLLRKDVSSQGTAVDYSDFIVTYENGDMVCNPGEESLAYDEDSYTIYYENLLVVYLDASMTEDEADALAEQVNGTIVGQLSGAINLLQISVPACDFQQLNAYADTLMEAEQVLYAAYEIPVSMTETADDNPWLENGVTITDKGNEENPDGNDWWAEAIGAYTAWDYVDRNQESLSEITIGILDSGFDTDHEEFLEKVFDMSKMQSVERSKITMLNTNSEDIHGTHVAGIIGAQNNYVGLRGIADLANLVCIDWQQEETDEEGNVTTQSLLSSVGYAELIKQLVENGAKVINNSWGVCYYSEEKYEEDEDLRSTYQSYQDYTLQWRNDVKTASWRCMMLVIQLLENRDTADDGEDFLLVFAAGNGYDNCGPGYPASLSMPTGEINEENYAFWTSWNPEKFERLGYTFDDIREHICVVGDATWDRTDDGAYLMASGSNYGKDVVDICAPGEHIYSTVIDGYGVLSGTSMSAPMVTAAAALVWSIDPSLTAGEVKETLLTSAGVAVGVTDEDAGEEYPMLNVGSAVMQTVKGTISGTVVDGETGEPLTGVTCTLTTDASDSEVFTTPTINKDDGSFRMAAVGTCTVTLEKDGYGTAEFTVEVEMRSEVDVGEIALMPPEPDYLEYEMVEWYDSADTSDGRQVGYASGSYPSFTGKGAAGLNEYILSKVPEWAFHSEYAEKDGDALYEEYLEIYSDIDDLWDYLPFYDQFYMEVCDIGDDYVQLAYRSGMWSGGAHAYWYYYSVYYDLTTGEVEESEIDMETYGVLMEETGNTASTHIELYACLSDFDAFEQAVIGQLICDSVEEPDEDFIDIMAEVDYGSYDEILARYTCYSYSGDGIEAQFNGEGECVYLELSNSIYSICGAYIGQTREDLQSMESYVLDGETFRYLFEGNNGVGTLDRGRLSVEVQFDADNRVSSIQVQDVR